MMRSVEQQRELAAVPARPADTGDQLGIGPFVDENHIRGRPCGLMVEDSVVCFHRQVGEICAEASNHRDALDTPGIGAAPGLLRLRRARPMDTQGKYPNEAAAKKSA